MRARQLALLSLLLRWSDATAIDPGRVVIGDKLHVAVDGTELHSRGSRDTRLKRGAELHVVEVRDSWIGGTAMIDGQEQKGWVASRKLFKRDDADDRAALKDGPFRLATDFSGNVFEAATAGKKVTGKDLARLKGLYSLEALDLSETNVTDEHLNLLRGLTNFRRLYLSRTAISDRALEVVATLPRVEVLSLGGTRVSGVGLSQLTKLKDLHVLNLSGCGIGDDDLPILGRLKSLRVLALDETRIDGSGLDQLRGLTHLNLLNLNCCKLKQNTILTLRGLDGLRALYVDRALLDDAAQRQLNRLLPRLAVIKRAE